jgi:HlyD family secretion protein
MEIVPENDQLIIEGKFDPRDIDQVVTGADAVVKIMAGEERANPDLNGKVILVSADLTRERAAAGVPERAYYTVRVSLPKKEVERLGELKLLPGMQAEVFIQTYPRTPLAYLIKPLKDQMGRTFRER